MVLWSMKQRKAIQLLALKFKIDFPHENMHSCYMYYCFLELLDEKLEALLAERGEAYFQEIDEKIHWAIRQLTFSELVSMSFGIDYNLELWRKSSMVSKENHPALYFCLVTLPKINNEGLINENHGMGYHIHYVVIQKKKQERTNIVFTFNPSGVSTSQNVLYWEHHGSGVNREPDKFGKRRRNAIYDTSCSFLNKVPKIEFRAPVSAANVLWPQ